MSGNIIYTVPWVGGTGNIGYPSSNSSGSYEGKFYIDNGGLSDNYYGLHLDGDSYGYIKPPKLSNGMQPLDIMTYVENRRAHDNVIVTFKDAAGEISESMFAEIIIDDAYALCATFNDVSANNNPQFTQQNSALSSYLLDGLHDIKNIKIATGSSDTPLGERHDFTVTQQSIINSGAAGEKYYHIGYNGNPPLSAIEPSSIGDHEIYYLRIRDSTKYGAKIEASSKSFENKYVTITYNNNPRLTAPNTEQLFDSSIVHVRNMRWCKNGIKIPCSVYLADSYTLTVARSNDSIGFALSNQLSALVPNKLNGYVITAFEYLYESKTALIRFDTSIGGFTKIFFDIDGERFCAEQSTSDNVFVVTKTDKFATILERFDGGSVEFPMVVKTN